MGSLFSARAVVFDESRSVNEGTKPFLLLSAGECLPSFVLPTFVFGTLLICAL